ncbi:MAG: hypothetical protein AAB871_02190 [Patescibacteria group bacterium]
MMNFNLKKNLSQGESRDKFNEGISLVLAIFILAATSMISFSFSALVIREIRTSREQVRSEAVIATAEGGAETALYFQQRGLTSGGNVVICPATIHQNSPSFPMGQASYDYCSNLYDNPYVFVSSFDNTDVMLLNDPLNPEDPAAEAGYTDIDVTITSAGGGAIGARVDVFDLSNPNSDPENPDFTTSGLAPGGLIINGLDPDRSYAAFIYPCTNPAGNPLACSFGSVSGFAEAIGGALGIP